MIDRLFGVFLLFLGIYFIWGGNQLEVPFSYDPLGPKFFPIAAGVILSILAVFTIINAKKVSFPASNTMLKTGFIVILLVIYQLTFDVLGFLLSTGILVFFISRIFAGKPLQALSAAVGVSITVYIIFNILLDVPLPVGTIFTSLLGAS
ncbi:MAG: tripartite tricarboxylate transporter TctB family protein [Leptotrichiaceae bacterium]|jgi:putative tricarboxylic transport membrane protein|nr:tripartite tricarboxylate transporter TctB family protein [Leptotrichiaceae bacterium]MBP6409046.1 tripartite tricarboxylate transporter TctB family protein [Fusobacteriaceae bacterium]